MAETEDEAEVEDEAGGGHWHCAHGSLSLRGASPGAAVTPQHPCALPGAVQVLKSPCVHPPLPCSKTRSPGSNRARASVEAPHYVRLGYARPLPPACPISRVNRIASTRPIYQTTSPSSGTQTAYLAIHGQFCPHSHAPSPPC